MPTSPRHENLAAAAARVGDRWSLLLVDALLGGPRRFNDLAGAVPVIAPNVLTQRLRHLEQQGLLVGTPYSRRPVRLSYELTAAGRDLADALTLLAAWGARHDPAHRGGDRGPGAAGDADAAGVDPGGAGVDDPGAHHATCGTTLEARLWCPTCERVVDPDEPDELARV
jgi:DNA-binding HxlR family transcriptional regulator